MTDRPNLPEDPTLPLPARGGRSPVRFHPEASRYQILEELARGGMGLVYRALDPALDRILALKVLREDHADNPEMIQRFLEEARVAGRLQHPGIVPVYDIGRFADNRPFFTMKLVEGRTLAALLAERRDTNDNIPRLLGIFQTVCQTMAYAHVRQVIHRDLKPANIMVGAFGEVQVMDWGLAKILDDLPEAAPRTVQGHDETASTVSHVEHTLAGSAIGTPAYMAPEQARGDASSRRVDVFGLGGILSEILTGKPPFILPRSVAAWLLAQDRDLGAVHERLEACGHDRELIALCRDCLANDPAARPADAVAVTERIDAYLAGVRQRLRQAELDRAAADARAEAARQHARSERQARRLLAGLACATVVLLALGMGTVLWWHSRQQVTQQRVEILMAEASHFTRQAESASSSSQALPLWREAGTLVDQASEVVAAAFADGKLRDRVLQEKVRIHTMIEVLARERKFLDRLAEIRVQKDDENSNDQTEKTYTSAFRDHGLDVDNRTMADLAERIRKRPAEVVGAILTALDDWCLERRRAKMPESSWTPLLRLATAIDDSPWRKKVRSELMRSRTARLHREYLLFDTISQLRMSGGFAPHLFASGLEIARLRAHLRHLGGSTDKDQLSTGNLRLLASLLLDEGDTSEAIRLLRVAQKRTPNDLWLNYDLGQALRQWVRMHPGSGSLAQEEAIRYLMAAHAIRPEIGHSLAHALAERGQGQEAIDVFRELIRLSPTNASNHGCLSVALMVAGRPAEAEKGFREAIRLAPGRPDYRTNLGVALTAQKKFSEAEKRFREALALSPEDPNVLLRLGRLFVQKKSLDEAQVYLERAIAREPRQIEARFDLARLHEARGEREKALVHYRAILGESSGSADSYVRMGAILRDSQPELAIHYWRRAVAINPRLEQVHDSLGRLLLNQRRPSEAIPSFRQSLNLNPNNASAAVGLAVALVAADRLEEALVYFEETLPRFPRASVLAYNHAHLLSRLGRKDEAIRAYGKTIAIDVNYAEAHCNLGLILRDRGEFQAALAALQRGHAIGARRPNWKNPSDKWLVDCRHLVAIERRLPGMLSGQRPARNEAERILACRACRLKGKHAGAVQLVVEALADPRQQTRFNRYQAATSGVLAGTGQSRDSTDLSAMQRHALRLRGLTWITAEFHARASGPNRRTWCEACLADPTWTAVRDPARLAVVPAEERCAWEVFWNEVRRGLRSAGGRRDPHAYR